MSFLWRMDKQTIIHTHNVVLLNNKEEQIPDRCNSLDGSQRHCALVKDVYLQKLQTV